MSQNCRTIFYDFMMINFCFVIFGSMMMVLGLSFKSILDTLMMPDARNNLLYLGLMFFLSSLGEMGLVVMILKAIKMGMKFLVITLIMLVKIVPVLMASLTLISLMQQCEKLAGVLSSDYIGSFIIKDFLSIIFYFMTLIGWLLYFWFTLTKLEIFFHLQQHTPQSTEVNWWRCPGWSGGCTNGCGRSPSHLWGLVRQQ